MSPRPAKFVAYLRVSTARQGASGLGLEAQQQAVRSYAQASGVEIVAEYIEVESGKRADRPQLLAALAACKLHRATLLIAKLDRLARNVAFVAGLMDGGADFIACDMPHANRLTLHLMAAMAEAEAAAISERTKAALAAAKARGVKLGNPQGAAHLRVDCKEAAAKSAAARRTVADARAAQVMPTLVAISQECGGSARRIALELNRRGLPAPSGGTWYPEQIRRTLRREF